MSSPNWIAYTYSGYDRYVNWELVSDVAQTCLGDLFKRFVDGDDADKLQSFQKRLKDEADWQFD